MTTLGLDTLELTDKFPTVADTTRMLTVKWVWQSKHDLIFLSNITNLHL